MVIAMAVEMAWLKDEKQRTLSSRTWLERQLHDPYVMRAKREGFRSRAAYKLAEIDDKYRVLKPGARVVDLGAAPGGWSEIAARRVGADGRVIALDILDMKPIVGVEFLNLDFLDDAAPEQLKAMLGGKVDVVLSDMAANATGHRKTDHLRIMALAEAAAQFAREVLAEGGTFRLQGAARRHRSRVTRRTQARVRERQARQAAGEPQRIRRSFICWRAAFAALRAVNRPPAPARPCAPKAPRRHRARDDRRSAPRSPPARRSQETPAGNPRRSSPFHAAAAA